MNNLPSSLVGTLGATNVFVGVLVLGAADWSFYMDNKQFNNVLIEI